MRGCPGRSGRVLIPEGRLGVTFWGRPERNGLLPYLLKAFELSPASHVAASMEQGDTRNVIVDLLTNAGFGDVEQGTVDVVTESPDVATAVRAMAAAGPSVPAIEAVGYDEYCRSLSEVIAPLYVDGLGVRTTSEFGWATARPS